MSLLIAVRPSSLCNAVPRDVRPARTASTNGLGWGKWAEQEEREYKVREFVQMSCSSPHLSVRVISLAFYATHAQQTQLVIYSFVPQILQAGRIRRRTLLMSWKFILWVMRDRWPSYITALAITGSLDPKEADV